MVLWIGIGSGIDKLSVDLKLDESAIIELTGSETHFFKMLIFIKNREQIIKNIFDKKFKLEEN
jgi:hypothetical protein